MRSKFGKKSVLSLLLCVLTSIGSSVAKSQASKTHAGCGKTTVHMVNPVFLTTPAAIIAVKPPPRWVLDKTRNNPFYLLRVGDRYEGARTVIYINVQRLDGSFEQAVENDERDFRRHDPSVQIQNEPQPEILERGCAVKTQRFIYERQQKRYVDQVTKIAIGGLLLNVVLSSDSEAEIARYQSDYKYLLKHLARVTSTPMRARQTK